MMNNFSGAGNLTRDAELKYTPSGKAVSEFSICINDSYKKDDKWVEKPYFFKCVLWGKYGESMNKHLTKGRLIGVEGKLAHNPWKDNNGTTHNDCTIVAVKVHLFPKTGSGNNSASGNPPPGEETAGNGPDYDDEIPY